MGYVYALVAAMLFGVNGSVTKVIIDTGITPSQLTLFRVGGTALIAAIVLLVSHRAAFRISGRHALLLAVLGVAGTALLQWTYATAVSLIPVGIALLIEFTAVLLVAIVAFFFFKEQVKTRLWAAIALVLVGLVFVAEAWASQLDGIGVLFAVAASLCLATYFLLGERLVGASSPMAVGFWSMSFATIFWFVFGDWYQLEPGAFTVMTDLGGTLAGIELPLWAIIAWNVLMGSFAPFLLTLLALRYLTATAAGITASAEVIFAFLFAWLWLTQGLSMWQLIGVCVVLTGIVLAQTARINKVVVPDQAIADPESDRIL